jgi:methylenetetrahydrofolate dehydrogenase (NADP+)/methenyltetrahydrofolate cyclohydrolase
MTKILKAQAVIDHKLPVLIEKAQELTKLGLKPKLSVILVGDNSASLIYIRNKKRFCEDLGIDFQLINLDESTDEAEFMGQLHIINNDPLVTGCFVQLPVPNHLAHIDITQLIHPTKDVDGFHLNSVNKLYLNKLDGIIPCTPKGIMTMLAENQIEIKGKNITIIGRSFIVGKPLSLLLTSMNATVTLCHSQTNNLNQHTKMADIIISAVGIPHYINRSFLNPAKNQILIDVGMNKLEGKTVGDIDFDDCHKHCRAITPVPGGVGPMTVFSLMENLLNTTENILKNQLNKEI